MEKHDKIVITLALLGVAVIVIKLIGSITGYDLIDMAVNATRPADAGGWPAGTH
ncbi:hypothetical protein PY650_19565 [Rhizobium calliandrae]|uniref:Uncharacterized protein n=1 Tax=Rhizobium calliandrae TaxID=1312182 RepID=A0ABT7KGR8_9HYPH|nr:hypothetical protein [Rhizobium calliandrae]MDL2407817.1 hypothetical protein [Rhizobium calliandrae]